jgi:hypothetical protein
VVGKTDMSRRVMSVKISIRVVMTQTDGKDTGRKE